MSPSTTYPAGHLTATVVTPASCPRDGDRRNAARTTTNYASRQNLQSEFTFASSNAKSSSPPARRKPVHRPKKYRFTENETAGEWKDLVVVDYPRNAQVCSNKCSRDAAITEGYNRYRNDPACKQLWKKIKDDAGGRLDNREVCQIKDKALTLSGYSTSIYKHSKKRFTQDEKDGE